MRRAAVVFGLALIAAAGAAAKAQDLYKPYRFCVASSLIKKEIYYSDVFKLTSDEALDNEWRQHLLLYHPSAEAASIDCSQASETRLSALAARDSALNGLRRRDVGLRVVDTEWTPHH